MINITRQPPTPTAIHLIPGKPSGSDSNNSSNNTSSSFHTTETAAATSPLESVVNRSSSGSVVSSGSCKALASLNVTSNTWDDNFGDATADCHPQQQEAKGFGINSADNHCCFDPFQVAPMDNYHLSLQQQLLQQQQQQQLSHVRQHVVSSNQLQQLESSNPMMNHVGSTTSSNKSNLHIQGTEPRDQDVLLGRGKSHQRHPGVVLFNDLINKNRVRYFEVTTHQEKKVITEIIVSRISETGGRFLKMEKRIQNWVEITHEAARIKVAQALQYRQRRNISEEEEGIDGPLSTSISSGYVRKQHRKVSTSSTSSMYPNKSVVAAAMMMRDQHRKTSSGKQIQHKLQGCAVPLTAETATAVAFERDMFQWNDVTIATSCNQRKQIPSGDACVSGIFPIPLSRRMMNSASQSTFSSQQELALQSCHDASTPSMINQQFNPMHNTRLRVQSQPNADQQLLQPRTMAYNNNIRISSTGNITLPMQSVPTINAVMKGNQLQAATSSEGPFQCSSRSSACATSQHGTAMLKQQIPQCGSSGDNGGYVNSINNNTVILAANNSSDATYASIQSVQANTNYQGNHQQQSDAANKSWEASAPPIAFLENDTESIANFQW